ncbi:MAG: EVE domain-containing protein [Rickettsiella sp.]|nr:EVE domain-containing protein [Rickettsiella sp.]
MKHYWLMKSEPTSFSIDDLANRRKQIEPWDGVRNYQARNFLQAMQKGDQAFFYHSSCAIPGIAGIVEIIKTAYPDKTAFDPLNHHYDPKSTLNKPKWFCVDVKLVEKFTQLITLETLKKQPYLRSMRLLQKGNRLSVLPIILQEWETILSLIR